MIDNLDLSAVHEAHTPDPEFRRALRIRIERTLTNANPRPANPIASASPGEMYVAPAPLPDRRRRSRRLIAAVVVAVTIATVAILSSRRDSSPPVEPQPTTTTPVPTPAVTKNGSVAFVDGSVPVGDVMSMYIARSMYIVEPDGTGLRQLTLTPGRNYSPAWSPDGTRLAYVHDSELVVIDARSGAEEFTASLPEATEKLLPPHLEWAPDGASILVCHHAHPFISEVVELRTGERHNIVEPTSGPPHWSPDGKWLLVPAGDLYLVPTQLVRDGDVVNIGSQPDVRRISVGPREVFLTSWAPDSSAIAITAYATTGGPIELVTIAGGSIRTFVAAGYAPAWSPDGHQIAYLRGAAVWVASADGTDGHMAGASFIPPSWSPDGTRLVLLDEKGLFTVRSDGSDVVRLTPPELAPPSERVDWLQSLDTYDHQNGASGEFAPTWQPLPG